MTKEDIKHLFEIDDKDVIRSKGKFEGEPIWVVYLWNLLLNNSQDDEDDLGRALFYPMQEDFMEFPELKEYEVIAIWNDNLGFVNHEILKYADAKR